MGLLGFGNKNAQQEQMYSLLGVDPSAMRRQALFNGLAAAGFTLMGDKNPGNAGLAFVAGTDRARNDYMQTAMDAYRVKQAEESQNYQRGRDAKDDEWRQTQWDYNKGRQQKADAWQNTQMGWQMDDRQQQEDMRAGQQNAVEGFMGGFKQQGGDLFSPEMQMGLRQQGVAGVNPSDTQRYNKMQPYAQAEMYPEAFQQMTAQPESMNPTDDMREYTMALQQGYQGTFQQYMIEMKKAGATSIDNRQMGNIPPGYTVEYDAQNRPARMVPIPGGPAAAEAEKAGNVADAQQNKRMTITDTVTGAADAARALASDYGTTGLIGQGMSYLGQTDAAEVYRQTDVLKSTATIENLNAMRKESPTGGALGNVTEKEGAMLAAAAGALDPASGSERFQQQLDNYELTLMRVIHGYEAGTQMFMARRGAQQPQQASPTEGQPRIRRFNPQTGKIE